MVNAELGTTWGEKKIQAMNALQNMDRYWKEVVQVSTQKHDISLR